MAAPASSEFRELSFTLSSCVRGYHVYQSIWRPTIGETYDCTREYTNVKDRYAVAVKTAGGTTVGHLPLKISHLSSIFIRCGGRIMCEVTGTRQYSEDLSQGGLEIPCTYTFVGEKKYIDKLSRLNDLQR